MKFEPRIKILFAAFLAFCLASISACSSSCDVISSQGGAATQPQVDTTVNYHIHPEAITFFSANEKKEIMVHVTYNYKQTYVTTGIDPAVEKAVDWFEYPRDRWLLCYLEHYAYQYLNGELHAPNPRVSIKVEGLDKNDGFEKHRPWLVGSINNAFYNEASGALRSKDGKVMEIIPGNANPEDRWRALSPDSYSSWWDIVNSKVKLDELFGEESHDEPLKSAPK